MMPMSIFVTLLMALLLMFSLNYFVLICTTRDAIYCQKIPLAAYPTAISMKLLLWATARDSARQNVSSLLATTKAVSESARHREIMLPKNNTRNQNSDRCILHDLKKSSPIANWSVVLPLSFWASILFVLIKMASLCSFVTATRYGKGLKIVINAPTSVCVHCATHSKRVFKKADDCRQCLHLWDTLCKENSTTPFFEKMWGFLGPRVPNKLHNQANVVGLFVQQSAMLAFPATSFLPSLSALQQGGYKDCFDHVGSRLASLAAVPPSCNHSRIRLAEAGFHYDARLNPNAVICHRCGAVYDISSSSTTSLAPPVSSSSAPVSSSSSSSSTMTTSTLPPLPFHQQASPNCPVVNQSLIRNTPRSAENVASQCVSSTASLQQAKVEASSSSSSLTSSSRTVSAGGAVALTTAQSRPVTATLNASGRDIFEDCDAAGPLLVTQGAGATNNQNMQTDAMNIAGYTLALSSSSADQRRSVVQPHNGTTGTGSAGTEVDRTPLDLSGAVYPQFSTASMRLGTFRNWPLMTIFPPQSLVSLGFYYAGYADCIRCFYCGVGLKSWDPADDVLTEHVRWRPQCSFLLATKGSQVVEDITNKLNRRCGPETTK